MSNRKKSKESDLSKGGNNISKRKGGSSRKNGSNRKGSKGSKGSRIFRSLTSSNSTKTGVGEENSGSGIRSSEPRDQFNNNSNNNKSKKEKISKFFSKFRILSKSVNKNTKLNDIYKSDIYKEMPELDAVAGPVKTVRIVIIGQESGSTAYVDRFLTGKFTKSSHNFPNASRPSSSSLVVPGSKLGSTLTSTLSSSFKKPSNTSHHTMTAKSAIAEGIKDWERSGTRLATVENFSVLAEVRHVSGSDSAKRFRHVWMTWADVIILTYSVGSRLSFERVNDYYSSIIESDYTSTTANSSKDSKKEVGQSSTANKRKILLVGTHADIPTKDRRVSFSDGSSRAVELGSDFYEVSSYSGQGVIDSFYAGIKAALGSNQKKAVKLLWSHFTQDSAVESISAPQDIQRTTHVDLIPNIRNKSSSVDIVWKAEEFEFVEILGYGSFGVVYKAIWQHSPVPFAVKVLKLEGKKEVSLEEVEKEYSTLKLLNHENIIFYYGICTSEDEIWILTEYCDTGSLYYVMKEVSPSLSEDQACYTCFAILSALNYLHNNINLLHRDLKAHNLLLTSKGVIKLADFGLSRVFFGDDDFTNAFLGTLQWMAPEVFKQDNYSYKSDIWSLGITLFEILWGDAPNRRLGAVGIYQKYMAEGAPKLPNANKYSKQCIDFLSSCLVIDPEERKSAAELLEHPWIKANKGPKTMIPLATKYLKIRLKQRQEWEKQQAAKGSTVLRKEAEAQAAMLNNR